MIKSMRTSILERLIDNTNYFNFQIFRLDSIVVNLVQECYVDINFLRTKWLFMKA